MHNDWLLVGRDEELAFLSSAIERGSALISGRPGVGKSRLARELTERLEHAGRTVHRVRATAAAASVPLGAFAPFLPPLGQPDAPALSLLIGARQALGFEGSVVAVDDAHLLDDLSATLVHQLVTTPGVVLVVTLRTGEPAPDPVVSLWKDELAAAVELQPLSRAETDALAVAAVGGGPVESRTLERIWTLSEGNPLLLRELVQSGLELGDLRQADGLWRADGIGVGARLIELVEMRLRRLPPELRTTLELLAFGEPMSPALLSQVRPGSAVSELERRALVRVETSGKRVEIRLAHPLYTEVLRALTPSLEADAIRRSLAEAVEGHGARRREDLLRVALWRLESRSATDAEMMTLAAKIANESADYVLGERLARAALDADPSATYAPLVLAVSLRYQARYAEALESLARIPAEVLRAQEVEYRLSVAAIAAEAHEELGDVDAALDALDAAVPEMDDTLRPYPRANRAAVLARAGRIAEALVEALPLLEDESIDVRVRLRALSVAGILLAGTGRADTALERAIALYPEAQAQRGALPYAWQWVGETVFVALFLTGRLSDARALLDTAAGELGSIRDRGHDVLGYVHGRLHLLEGRPASAVQALLESAGGGDTFRESRALYALLAEAYAALGDLDAAAKAATQSAAERRTAYRYDAERALAWVDAARGDMSRAVGALLDTASWLREAGQHLVEAHVLHDAARLGAADKVAARLEELVGLVDGEWAPAFAVHARGLATPNGYALDDASRRFEAIGASLHAAEAALEASVAHARAGRKASAASAAARGERLATLCEGATTPAMRAASTPLPLTRREREIAGLAAGGLSNKEIAERLVVSVRTVESHLQEAYTKLGITSRAELAAVFGD